MIKQLSYKEYLKQVLIETQKTKRQIEELERSLERVLSLSDMDTMISYYKGRGMSYAQIAKEVGISPSAVYARVKKMEASK